MSMPAKLTTERNQKAVLELVVKPGNDICADCKARNPRWASHNLGIFICVNCASIHRKIGTHITKVKSLTMDSWTKDQVDSMRNMGNVKSNAIFNPNEIRHPPPPNLEDSERDSELEQYIRGKYEYRKFLDKSALVASKLGPSRSATSITPRSASSPLTSSQRASTLSASSTSASQLSSATPKTPSSSTLPPSQSQPSPASIPPRNASIIQSRSVSQPVIAQQPQTQHKAASKGGVWDDLIQLQDPSPSSSLPLQFQQQPTGYISNSPSMPFTQMPTGMNGMNSMPMGMTPTGMGVNPYQQQGFATNPFSQQQALPSPFLPNTPFTPSVSQQSYGQQLFMSQMGQASPNPMSAPVQGQFFQPQPQSSLQVQSGQQQMFLSPSPSHPLSSAPNGHFLTPSPGQQQQYFSHSPQLQMQNPATPNQFISSSPQLMMDGQQSHSPMPTMMSNQTQGQFMGAAPAQQQTSSLQQLPQSMMSPAQFYGFNTGQGFQQQQSPFGQRQWGAM